MKKEIIKPFDLEKAKAGAKLRTRNGCPVEIFKWDARGAYPIKGIVKEEKQDSVESWTCRGSLYKNGESSLLDLVIVEEVEEPKFKVGDWVVYCNDDVDLITGIDKNGYSINNGGYIPFMCARGTRLWTIQDAKDGDVLSWDNSKCIALFKNIYNEDTFNSYGLVGHCTGIFEPRQAYHYIEGAHPATKEQRDLLFQKMKEAGYEWDSKKLELKKIKPKFWSDNKNNTIGGFFMDISADIEEAVKVSNTEDNYDVFATKKQAKAALAMARISQIMANDIENFGGVVTDEEWENAAWKFIIYRDSCSISTTSIMSDYSFLAFHTKKQRDLFLEKYPQLIKDYLMINE